MGEFWNEVTAEWQGESAFIGKNSAGGSVQLGARDNNPGISPMELMLVGVAGCTGIDIVNIMRKKRQEVMDFQVKVRGKRADNHPKVYTQIEVEYILWGDNLDVKAIEHAIQLSEEKYCSAKIRLSAAPS